MKKQTIALAACSSELSATIPTEFRIVPDGNFSARDGRPSGVDSWVMNAELAANIIEQVNSQQDDLLIDFEHQSLYAKANGQPNNAAGWFKSLEYRSGDGLYAVNVKWTEKAALAIQNNEYRYVSPVIQFNQKTGEVTKLLMCAITNTPAIDGLTDLTALAADYFSQPTEALSVDLDELLERLRYLFNLPTLATIEDVKVELDKLKTLLDATPSETAAASSIFNLLESKTMPENKDAVTVDLSTHVPVEAVHELQKELAALNAKINQKAVDDLVSVGLSDGRITPALKDWASKLDHAALSLYLEKATPIAALTGTQTDGKEPEAKPEPLTPEETAVCLAMNLSPEQFIATKGA